MKWKKPPVCKQVFRDERKYELCAEGHRRLNLIRWFFLVETVKNTAHRFWNNPGDNIQSHQVLYPIPEADILLNPALLESDTTNNGYDRIKISKSI